MKKYCSLLLIAFAGLFSKAVYAQCALSGSYTINSAVPTGGTNYQTFTAAINALSSCGVSGPVVFNVATGSGPYAEQLLIPAITNASAINTITFNGNGCTISRSTTSAHRGLIKLNGADYITINDFVINPTGTYRYGVQFYNNADNNIINGCKIELDINTSSSNQAGIVMSGSATSATGTGTTACDSNVISNNIIDGGYYGITMTSSGTTVASTIYNNMITGNTIKNTYYYGMYLQGNNGAVIDSNEIIRPDRTTFTTGYGLYFTTYNTNLRVNANRIHDVFAASTTSTSAYYCIYSSGDATAGNENLFTNNLIYNIQGNGTHYGIRNVGADYNQYYYNTISFDYAAASSGTTYGFYQSTSATGIIFKNNIVNITRGGGSTKYCFYKGTAASPVTGDFNDYYINAAGANIGYASGARATLSAWQSASGFDANSVNIDPVFANAAAGDYKPTSVALNNLADPVTGIETDIIDEERHPVNPDMGAYEFLNCRMPKNLAVSSVTSNNAELQWAPVSGTAGYEYVVDQSSTPPTTAGTFTNTNSHTAINLANATTFYFHLRNICSGGIYSDWVTVEFATTFNPCPYPASIVVTPTSLSSVDYSWFPVVNSAGYEYVIDQDPSNPLSGTATSTISGSSSGLLAEQTYYLHVRSKCAANIWSDWTVQQFVMPTCDEPNNIIVSNISANSVDILWSLMPGAANYEYQVDQSLAPPAGGTGLSVTTGISASINGLLANTKYYIHLRSRCFSYDSSAWAIDSFVTHNGCGAPALTVNNANTSSPDAYWTPVPTAIAYEWAMSSSASNPPFGTEVLGTSVALSLPNDGKDYYLHVRTKCNSMFEFSNWSTAVLRNATTGVETITSEHILIYPNPAHDNITIELGEKQYPGVVTVYDVAGQKMKQESVGTAHTVINVSSLPVGVYLLKYEYDNQHFIKRIIKD
jgi:hypothetical protein